MTHEINPKAMTTFDRAYAEMYPGSLAAYVAHRIAQEGLELPDEAPPVSERTKLVAILWIIVVGSLSFASGALAYGWLR